MKSKARAYLASFFCVGLLLVAQAAFADDPDPGERGPRKVTREEYDFGDQAFQPPGWPAEWSVELRAVVHSPTDLTDGPFPLIIFLHGRHATCFLGTTAFLQWPCTPPRTEIPSYRGYDYVADFLASHGYIVASIGANGINARDNFFFDLGMEARGALVQRHLDHWRMLNTTGGAFFGGRFIGKVDLQNAGTMGHSRGGEGVARHFVHNAALGSPYGVRAVFPLAPVDFHRPVVNRAAQTVLLPYCDGDVSDLQGMHFYDDARYNVSGDPAAKHVVSVMGANHNFYNTIWTPGEFPAGTADDWLAFVSGGSADSHCGTVPGNRRLTPAQQRGTGLAYMAAFFRTYIGLETQFRPYLTGDAPPPPSAMTSEIFVSQHPGDIPQFRRDVNRLLEESNLTVNTLGGDVIASGLTPYDLCGGEAPQPPSCLPGQPNSRQPHTTPSARNIRRGLSQNRLGWSAKTAMLQNDLPEGTRDVSGYFALQFRAGVNFTDSRNPAGLAKDFSVKLMDGAGNTATRLVSDSSGALFFPPGGPAVVPLPKLFLNTVRIPLFSFTGIDKTDIRSIQFNFDQQTQGALMISDLAFADPNPAGPFALLSTPSENRPPPANAVRVAFDREIDPATFTTADVASFTRTVGKTVTDLLPDLMAVTPVPGSGNRQFDVSFATQSATGLYSLVIGPDIRDLAGNQMDQNSNRVAGEDPGDRYTTTFGLTGPRINTHAPLGTTVSPVSNVRVIFSGAMDPATFTTGDIVSFTGPGGDIPISGVTVVDGTSNTQFDITFDPQEASGSYTMVIGPDIRDTFNNQMDQNNNLNPGEVPGDRYAAAFNLNCFPSDEFGYGACTHAFEAINLEPGQPGVVTLLVAADDSVVQVNIGANTFNFYGTEFSQLFISSNGLITFVSGNAGFINTDLTFAPLQHAIAPLWDDWWKENGTPANPMILGKLDGDRLIIEWNSVFHFDSSQTNPATFQAILQLNTGEAAGAITFNYPDLIVDDPGLNDGSNATVGIKDSGVQGARRLLVSLDRASPFVQSGRAIRVERP